MGITKEFLLNLYVGEKKSLREIGLLIGKSPRQVCRYLKQFNIKARNPSFVKGSKTRLGAILSQETKDKISRGHTGKKLTSEHREKVIKTLNHRVGAGNGGWKGGVFINPKGYRYLRMAGHPNVQSNGYVPEHRFVMEQHLGRLLGRFEHVHHINGNKSDNRVENLELVNAQTHNLITMMEIRIKSLERENEDLRQLLTNQNN